MISSRIVSITSNNHFHWQYTVFSLIWRKEDTIFLKDIIVIKDVDICVQGD